MRKPFQVEGVPDKRSVGLPHGVETDDYVFVASMALHPSEPRRDDNTDARWEYGNHPMRTTLFVGIALDCRVELDAIAVKPTRGS